MGEPLLNILLVIIAVILLTIASYQDIKARLVSDWIWLLMIGGGSILHLLQFVIALNESINMDEYLFSLFMNVIIALLLGLFLMLSALGGEADRIAFFAIAFVTPQQSAIFPIANADYVYLFSFLPKIIGTFFNAYLLAILVPIGIFLYNLIQKRRKGLKYIYPQTSTLAKLFLHFIGYPKATNAISKEINENPWHFDFLEDFVDGEWKIKFQMQLDTPEADLEKKLKLAELLEANEKDFVWVQPSLPFIFFILIGFILEILMGNLILSIMSFIL